MQIIQNLLFLFFLYLSALNWRSITAQSLCPAGWIENRPASTCYKVFGKNVAKQWNDAIQACRNINAYLTTIDSVDEKTIVDQIIDASLDDEYWLGGYRRTQDRVWVWHETKAYIDGSSPITWIDGRPDQTSGDCLQLAKKGAYSNEDCTIAKPYVCERNVGLSTYCEMDSGWENVDQTCVKVFQTKLTWLEAREKCTDEGSDLVIVANKSMQLYLSDWSRTEKAAIWLGLSDYYQYREKLTWSDFTLNTQNDFWAVNQPAFTSSHDDPSNCVAMNDFNNFNNWKIEDCTSSLYFACQKPSGVCPPGWVPFRNKCYLFNEQRSSFTDWYDAQTICSSYRGNMLTIKTELVQKFIEKHLANVFSNADFWLGAQRLFYDLVFKWEDKTEVRDFSHWLGGRPTVEATRTNCAVVSNARGLWYATSNCFQKLGYICEANTDTVIISQTSKIKTRDGNSMGRSCQFPFVYKGQTYYNCIKNNRTDLWCATSGNYDIDGFWGFCQYVGVCDNDWSEFNSNCFKKIDEAYLLSWNMAKGKCEALGANLAVLKDAKTQSFVDKLLTGSNFYWIGLQNLNNEWGWIDNSNVNDFKNWKVGNPTMTTGPGCGIISGEELFLGEWTSFPCTSLASSSFICQKKAASEIIPSVPTTSKTTWSQKCGFGWLERPLSIYCYLFREDYVNFNEAVNKCSANNGQLLTITTVDEQIYVQNTLTTLKSDSYWLGATSQSTQKGWRWNDDFPFIFVNWAQGQYQTGPDQYCAVVSNSLKGQWKTVNCDLKGYGFICKKQQSTFTTRSTTLPTTIPGVQYGCQEGWQYFKNDYCYRHFNLLRTFDQAKAGCRENGGELVELYSRDENDFLTYFLFIMNQEFDISNGSDTAVSWIGMYDELIGLSQVYFKWNSGSFPTFTNWAVGQPEIHTMSDNYKCVSLVISDRRALNADEPGQWKVTECDLRLTYTCRKPVEKVNSIITTTSIPGCPSGFKSHEERCYIVQSEYTSWQDADKACQEKNARLATVNDRFLQYWISNSLISRGQSPTVWIGLSDFVFPGSLLWANREPLLFTNWDRNEPAKGPNKNCVAMNPNGFWSKYDCSAKFLSVCSARNAAITTPTTKPTPPPVKCPNGWSDGDDSCYKLFDSKEKSDGKTWFEAEAFCRNKGGHLASFKSRAGFQKMYNEQMTTVDQRLKFIWIGLNRVDSGTFQWSDGSPVGFLNWAYQQPDNHNGLEDCAGIKEFGGSWYDSNCYTKKSWICRIEKNVNPDEIDEVIPEDVFDNPSKCSISDNSTLDWIQYQFKCFYISKGLNEENKLTWFKAKQFCNDNGGFLASIHSKRELLFLLTNAGKQLDRWWIGLNQLTPKAGFVWSDGSPVNYLNWDKNEPNGADGGENCVEMLGFNSFWNDANCGISQGFVCEKFTIASNEMPNSFVQPLSFGDGAVCPPGYSSFGLTTTGGTANSKPCFFPFVYKGKSYYECITNDRPNPWCATTADYDKDGQWGNCLEVKCFKIVDEPKAFVDGRRHCQNEKASLASISSDLEQDYVTALLRGKKRSYYIGGSVMGAQQTGSAFFWDDNTEFGYTKWASGNPSGNPLVNNQRCIVLSTNVNSPGQWENVNCYVRNPFICSINTFGVKYSAGCQNSKVHDKLRLTCEANHKVLVIKTYYGRELYSETCDEGVRTSSCQTNSDEAKKVLLNLCLNNQTCEISLDNQVLDDPCPDVIKSLKVWYQCVPVVNTIGGTANGAPCVFPFKYKGDLVYQCVYGGGDRKWCGTTSDYDSDKKWGYCPESPQKQNPSCTKPGYMSLDSGKNCYKLVNSESKNWNDAQTHCQDDGGNLVSIRDGFEQAHVNLIKYSSSVQSQWIGLKNNDSSQFFWSDDWPLTFSNWASEFVNDSQIVDYCGYIRENDSYWDAMPCDTQNNFICKISKDAKPEDVRQFPGHCPTREWIPYRSNCYKLEKGFITYPEARFDCFMQGGHVVSINTKEELEFVNDFVDDQFSNFATSIWLGLEKNKLTNSYQWSDGSSLTFTSFAPTFKSTEFCVYLKSNQWFDTECFYSRNSYICKLPKTLNITTTVEPAEDISIISTSTSTTQSTTTSSSTTSTTPIRIVPSEPVISTTASVEEPFTATTTNAEKVIRTTTPLHENKTLQLVSIVIGSIIAVVLIAGVGHFVFRRYNIYSRFGFGSTTAGTSNASYYSTKDGESVQILDKNFKNPNFSD